MANEAVEKSHAIASRLAERGERVGHKLDEITTAAPELLGRGKERARVARDNLSHSVQDRPMNSILIAAGVGLVIGALMSRR